VVLQALLFELDLSRYRHLTDLVGFSGCTCFALFSILLVTTIVTTVQRNDDLLATNTELHQAFERVGAVLSDTPTPYVLLDPNDLITDCNTAFCDFLGNKRSDVLGISFRDLIAEKDHMTYDGVQEQRKNEQEVDPYPATFKAAGGEEIRWVVSAAVPPAMDKPPAPFPETFGVLLSDRPQSAQKKQKAKAGG
jgi:PAS domain S-box-containing protein